MIIKTIIKLTLLISIPFIALDAKAIDKCKNKKIISQSPYITYSIDFFDMKECIVGASTRC